MESLRGERVVLRPTRPEDSAELGRLVRTPEVARWWPPPDDDAWPLDETDVASYTVLVDDAVIGLVQVSEEFDPDYRHAGLDLFLDPAVHGRGLGAEVLRVVARHLFAAGHHRLTIDPAEANTAAIRCYERVGFRRVGVMRRYERDRHTGVWRHGLLMDLLAEDLKEP
jgi:aminoglycoside 6'-N-acetyltransferase